MNTNHRAAVLKPWAAGMVISAALLAGLLSWGSSCAMATPSAPGESLFGSTAAETLRALLSETPAFVQMYGT